MYRPFQLVVSGDTIVNHRVSRCEDPEFLAVVDLLRNADVTQTQFEQLVHDYEGPEIYPAGDGSWGWFRAPRAVVDDLRWLGVDLVSTASNHSLDYSYGGLRETWDALRAAGIPFAGTGEDLVAARAPAFLDTPAGRVALVSACSSFPAFARAGGARPDLRGRPGLNPLRPYHRVDRETAGDLIDLATKLGHWVTTVGDEVAINPAGLHNSLFRFAVSDEPGVSTLPDEDDLAGNLAAIRQALAQADFVIAHLHAHEWDLDNGRMVSTPAFARTFARAAIDEGAHVVVVQGSHAPVRGIEVYNGRVIFYDPGDLFRYERPDKVPAEFYTRWGYGQEARQPGAGPPEAYRARRNVYGWGDGTPDFIRSPKTIYGALPGFFLPVCDVGTRGEIVGVTLYPLEYLQGGHMRAGLPGLATGARAREILEFVAELSEPLGTRITIDGDVAEVDLP